MSFEGGIIGQTLGLTRSVTIAPSAPSHQQNKEIAQNFESALLQGQGNLNTIGCNFFPCQPPNGQVAQKSVSKNVNYTPMLCCIVGLDQFQNSCLFELAMNDRKQRKNQGAPQPQGNLAALQASLSTTDQQQNQNQGNTLTNNLNAGQNLFGQTQSINLIPPAQTQLGGFGNTNQSPNGLFNQTTTPTTIGQNTGGLFGTFGAQNQGMFGNTPLLQAPPNNNNKKNQFGNNEPQQNLFGIQQQQQQPQQGGFITGQTVGNVFQQQLQQGNNQGMSVVMMIDEMKKIEDSKIFREKDKKRQNGKSGIFCFDNQQKKNDFQSYYSDNKNQTQNLIQVPYNVKVNESYYQVKRNEWHLLQKQQEMKNQLSFRDQYTPYNHYHSHHNNMYQTKQLKSQGKSIAQREKEYNEENLKLFSSSDYFKKMDSLLKNQEEANQQQNILKEDSIAYLFEQSLKRSSKTFQTTVRLMLNRGIVVIPVEIKSVNNVSYLLTKVFDYIEDHFHIEPESLPIYEKNYVLYQPKDIGHILQVKKTSLISEIETSQSGEIGHFEVVYLEEDDQSEVIGYENDDDEDEMEEEDQSFFLTKILEQLPIIPEGYSIEPSLTELKTKTIEQLKHFKNFKIRNEHAEICFEEEIDLTKRDFSKEISITQNEIILYPFQQANDPPVKPGYGINVQAIIKRFNASKLLLNSNEKYDIQKIERCIKKLAKEFNMQIVEQYNAKSDTFSVRVLHF